MASLNRVTLLGNLTRDPQLKATPGGTSVTELSLALNRSWFDRATQKRKEEVTFADVAVFGSQAEVATRYLGKGKPVLIEGRLQLDQWQDKESGETRTKLRVVCEQLHLLGGRPEGGDQPRKSEPDASPRGQSRPAGRPERQPVGAGRGRGPSPDEIPDGDVPF